MWHLFLFVLLGRVPATTDLQDPESWRYNSVLIDTWFNTDTRGGIYQGGELPEYFSKISPFDLTSRVLTKPDDTSLAPKKLLMVLNNVIDALYNYYYEHGKLSFIQEHYSRESFKVLEHQADVNETRTYTHYKIHMEI